jgi:hypothetical protein
MIAAQLSLFQVPDNPTPIARYPHGPGFKRHGTSSAAARHLANTAARLRTDVLHEFTAAPEPPMRLPSGSSVPR